MKYGENDIGNNHGESIGDNTIIMMHGDHEDHGDDDSSNERGYYETLLYGY